MKRLRLYWSKSGHRKIWGYPDIVIIGSSDMAHISLFGTSMEWAFAIGIRRKYRGERIRFALKKLVPPAKYTLEEYVEKFPSGVLHLVKILRARMDKVIAKKERQR